MGFAIPVIAQFAGCTATTQIALTPRFADASTNQYGTNGEGFSTVTTASCEIGAFMSSLEAKIRLGRGLEKEAKAKLRHLYDDRGRANATAIAKELGWRVPTLARALGLDSEILKQDPVAEKFQEMGHRVGKLLEALLYLFGDEQLMMKWLKRQNPDLRDSRYRKKHSPLDVIKSGHLEIIEDLVDDIFTGQPG